MFHPVASEMMMNWGKAAPVMMLIPSLALAQAKTDRASPAAPLVIGETFTIQSATLSETRRINVYLPSGYATSTNRLPVLYMPDGGMAEDFLHVAGLLQVSIGNETMRPFILVGIENTERRRDLTGPTQNAEDKKIAPHVGGSAAFRQFLRDELMPVVNARYRTTAETAIMGESLAGLFVVETFFLEPDLFDTYIAFDPSVWWNDGALVKHPPARLSSNGRHKSLYLASSRDDRDGLTGHLADVLRVNAAPGVSLYFEPMLNETHATIYHPAAMLALRRLFKTAPAIR